MSEPTGIRAIRQARARHAKRTAAYEKAGLSRAEAMRQARDDRAASFTKAVNAGLTAARGAPEETGNG